MDNSSLFYLVVACAAIVLFFDWTNGFHDASNILGPIVASRAMTPVQAVIVVACFELAGPVIAGTAVANTIGKFITMGDLNPMVSVGIVLTGLIGSIFWNLLTWWFGLPSSSSHALVGGLMGSCIAGAGADHVNWGIDAMMKGKMDGVVKIVVSLIGSPILGFWVGFAMYRFISVLFIKATPAANMGLKKVQFLSAAALSFSHGSNDAQKSMGILTLVLWLGGYLTLESGQKFPTVPTWVIYACAGMITLGILSGGWRIVRTIGFAIFKVRPIHAVCTQTTAGGLLFAGAVFGFPMSTTHVVSSAIMGIGASDRPKAVRWAKAKEIVSTWIITIPSSAFVSYITYVLVAWWFGISK
ncbi:MAG: inorganic phosphate transporter [Magnetococcales bacterium]|nr:inorganic phosphate transporter [Magnetococcales bacterium]